MINFENKMQEKKGFTLVELLIVIAIIGILASVVTVSSQGGIVKSKKASAITTLSSVLPELVTCQDDNGTINLYNVASKICNEASHSVLWPDISKSGYTVTAGAVNNAGISTYTFTAKNAAGTDTITCSYAKNSCD
jgi:prepilin-type N-terminal cleavage/methylation domain-containing protein